MKISGHAVGTTWPARIAETFVKILAVARWSLWQAGRPEKETEGGPNSIKS